jgi:hypothetical protein
MSLINLHHVILTLKFYFTAPFTYIYLIGIWIDIL